jgi:hypothetical protein
MLDEGGMAFLSGSSHTLQYLSAWQPDESMLQHKLYRLTIKDSFIKTKVLLIKVKQSKKSKAIPVTGLGGL